MKYIHFAHLCWKAYNGDLAAGMEVIGIIRERLGIS